MTKNTKINEEAQTKKRLLSLDFVKGIAIIFVVWGHADLRMDPVFYKENLEMIHEMIFSFHMPVFFVISAALIRKYIDSDVLSDLDFFKTITSKILVPYYSLNFLFGIIKLLTPKALYNAPSAKEMITAVLIEQSNGAMVPSGPLWFLFTLYSAALLTYFLVKKFRIGKYNLLIISVLLALAYPVFDEVDILGFRRLVYNFEFFVLGYILSDTIMNKVSMRLNGSLLFFVWVLAFLIKGVYGPFMHLITGVAGSIFIIIICQKMKHSHHNPLFRIIYLFGENSILIYVLHLPLFVLIKKIVYNLGLSGSFIGFFLMVVAGIVIPLVVGAIMGFNKTAYKLLFGRYPRQYNLLRS